MQVISSQQLTRTDLREYSGELSSCGFAPGVIPTEFVFESSAGRKIEVQYVSRDVLDGDLRWIDYAGYSGGSHYHVRLYND